ncbi:AzlC family ABC transporter permease [Nocardia cyriacigeorgica]|nr:branched-chain amino acid ABC transporter permease [Nocardia cyriacigeorgica]MBF6086829.1 AzlC family ABC transporter permease [Nocardia cyriacigeorgica]MBF6090846.1 AzlC family ABC transporter permease [Nocardia cyriacigeorgica]MBF6322263.1 AzlC family ABC transporter permease [Nocardia cyriacigeorgica]MBF6395542.1 AzlC family ABC transporter permease [Nocardia cyriacigeorgica]
MHSYCSGTWIPRNVCNQRASELRDHYRVQQLDPVPALAVPSRSRQEQVAAGIADSVSAGLGIFPLGIALGLLVVQAGLPWWLAPALSLAAFAGSLELLLVGMVAATAPLVAVAVTVFVVNFRHVFYAFSFPIHLVRNRFARVYSVYAMIDEAYAVSAALPPAQRSGPRLLTMQLASQAYWVGGGLVGVAIGAVIPGPIKGLEFALCALFTVLALDACRSRRDLPSVLLAVVAVGGALILTPQVALFVALLAFVVLLLIRYRLAGRKAVAVDA